MGLLGQPERRPHQEGKEQQRRPRQLLEVAHPELRQQLASEVGEHIRTFIAKPSRLSLHRSRNKPSTELVRSAQNNAQFGRNTYDSLLVLEPSAEQFALARGKGSWPMPTQEQPIVMLISPADTILPDHNKPQRSVQLITYEALHHATVQTSITYTWLEQPELRVQKAVHQDAVPLRPELPHTTLHDYSTQEVTGDDLRSLTTLLHNVHDALSYH